MVALPVPFGEGQSLHCYYVAAAPWNIQSRHRYFFPLIQGGITVRVIAGSARGRRLKSVRGTRTRPTTDRVKENLFNILGASVVQARVLDLFAGSGGIGIEALSRGAAIAVFVDNERACTEIIRANLINTSLLAKAEIYTNDVFRAIRILGQKHRQFDFIYLDPPYASGLADKALSAIADSSLLSGNGIVVAEHSSKEEIVQSALNLIRVRQARYGDTALSFYRIEGDGFEDLRMPRQL